VAEVPEPSYARSGVVSIAYQVVGEGPLDVIYVAGSGIQFEDRGIHSLKGVPDEWHLFSVVG
jgi:hypothetical protein